MIAVSMRMTRTSYPDGEQEVRDALAHDWWRFFQAALPHVSVVPVPNIGERVAAFLQELPITGIVLTGGDDWGQFPERDATEEHLVLRAERMALPIMGICRGAQVLNRLMGGHASSGFSGAHVRTRHVVHLRKNKSGPHLGAASLEVNSYHNLGIREGELAPALTAWATAEDGSVEAFSADCGRVAGIMWHPEREETARAHDVHLMQQLFNRKHP